MTPTDKPPGSAAFPHQAAKLSWACPIIIFGLSMFGRSFIPPLIMDLIAFGVMTIGLIFGLIALAGISRYGAKGILAPAIVGIILNGLLLFIFVTNFLAARARAQEHTGLKAGPILVASSNLSTAPNRLV